VFGLSVAAYAKIASSAVAEKMSAVNRRFDQRRFISGHTSPTGRTA
jgi:hypothetical protein